MRMTWTSGTSYSVADARVVGPVTVTSNVYICPASSDARPAPSLHHGLPRTSCAFRATSSPGYWQKRTQNSIAAASLMGVVNETCVTSKKWMNEQPYVAKVSQALLTTQVCPSPSLHACSTCVYVYSSNTHHKQTCFSWRGGCCKLLSRSIMK